MPHSATVALSLFCIAFPAQQAAGKVVQVPDGSNIVVIIEGTEKPVKLAGVDAGGALHPDETKAFLRSLVEGKAVSVEFTSESTALVYRTSDSLLVNLEMIRKGFAFADTDLPGADARRFRDAEREAENAGAGLWAGSRSERPSRRADGEIIDFKIGSTARVSASNMEANLKGQRVPCVVVARDGSQYAQFMTARSAADQEGIVELWRDGAIFFVPVAVRVRILRSHCNISNFRP